MKESFKEQFRDFVQQQGINFDELSDTSRSKQMARFFAVRILGPLNPTLIPEDAEEFEACVIDGKDDSGIDLLVVDEQSVVVVQAKYAGAKKQSRKPSEEKADFDRFLTVLKRMVEGPKIHAMNQKLREALAEVDFENANFQLFYITLRQIPDDLRILADRGIEPVSGISDLHERTSVELLDEEGLNIRLRDALSAAAGPTDVAVQFSESEDSHPWIAFADGKERTYLGRVTGSELAVMFQRYKSRLFGLNIRNYIGDNITNRTIRKTATKEPTKFFFFNNGVTALASGVEVDGSKPRTLRCRSFNIINGAQTVRSLSKAHSDDPDALRRVSVLIRIIEYPSKSSHIEQSFLDNVTRFNNTQNAIKISDFRSNDPIQQDIRAKFDKVPARKGKKFIYKNKRSTEGQAKIVVGMEEFAKTLYAFEYGPADAYGGTRHLFDASKTGGYTALYGRDGEVLPAISEETFRRYLGIWFSFDFAFFLLF
jgi:hypothetical protein